MTLLMPDQENPNLSDSLTGILKGNADIKQAKEEQLKEKYEITD